MAEPLDNVLKTFVANVVDLEAGLEDLAAESEILLATWDTLLEKLLADS
jgi:hypothetical protein